MAKRRIAESVDGFAELMAILADAGNSREDPIPVAIENPHGLLVAALRCRSCGRCCASTTPAPHLWPP